MVTEITAFFESLLALFLVGPLLISNWMRIGNHVQWCRAIFVDFSKPKTSGNNTCKNCFK